MADVRIGRGTDPQPARAVDAGLAWRNDDQAVEVTCTPAPDSVDAEDGRFTWKATLRRGERLTVTCEARSSAEAQFAPGGPPPWPADARVVAPDLRLTRVADRSLADLAGLLMRDGDDQFLAAGSPWFLTLFGRDSLWAARLLMPFGTDLALSTLRVLARRQGTTEDRDTEEQPGKILHEVRSGDLDLGEMTLPPVYYGTVDATPLFVCTLADAWAWGADRDAVRALLPAARRCLEWLIRQSAGSGWLRYVDSSGHGLANQGWKDSLDSVQFADGRLADPPIALSEVQAYGYEAAVRGAALLAAFGEPEVDGLAAWAEDLRSRFADGFWVDTEPGGHVAIALDGAGVRVDSVTSNMGHVLGTGILDEDRTRRVADVLAGPDMSSGFGLRTLTSRSPRFSRLSYHGGSVWPHDTAVAVRGLARDGFVDAAASLTAGVVAASEGVAYRLPELYGGDQADDVPFPTAYPAACRPQAWAAAAPLACLVAATGIEVDAPAGTVTVPATVSTRLGAYAVHGIRVGESRLTVRVADEGAVQVDVDGPPLAVTIR
jgi:glycogen debranching enzyme